MFNKFINRIPPSKLIGLKLGTVGFLIVAVGSLIIFVNVKIFGSLKFISLIGFIILLSGAAIFFGGMLIHLFLIIRPHRSS